MLAMLLTPMHGPVADADQFGAFQCTVEPLEDHPGDVLHARVELGEFRAFHVEVLVVERGDDQLVHGSIERRQIHDRSGAGIDRAAYGHFHDVVVSVTVWVAALAEKAPVLFVGQSGAVQTVGGGKLVGSRQSNHSGVIPMYGE